LVIDQPAFLGDKQNHWNHLLSLVSITNIIDIIDNMIRAKSLNKLLATLMTLTLANQS